jgi:hypothetical protein
MVRSFFLEPALETLAGLLLIFGGAYCFRLYARNFHRDEFAPSVFPAKSVIIMMLLGLLLVLRGTGLLPFRFF